MKKIFSFFLALMAVVAVNAAEVVFDFSDASAYGYANPSAGGNTQVATGGTISKEGVVMTITFSNGNGFRFFANTNSGVINLRGYVGAHFKIEAPQGSLLYSVVLVGTNVNGTYISGDLATGSWSSTTGAASIEGDIIKSTVQINTMTVVVAASGEAPEIWTPDTVTVSEALALIAAGDSHDHFVKGVVMGEPFLPTGTSYSFWMQDLNNENDTIEAFNIMKDAATAFANLEEIQDMIHMGDTVLVYAKAIQNYTNKTSNVTFAEINGGYIAEILGTAERAPKYDLTINAGVAAIDEDDLLELSLNNGADAVFEYVYQLSSNTAIAGEYIITEDNPAVVHYNDAEVEVTGSLKVIFVSAPAEGDFTYRVVVNVEDAEGNVYKADAEIVIAGTSACVNDLNSITCALAKKIGLELESNGVTEQTYKVYGYYAKFAGKYAYSKTGNYAYSQTFYMSDTKGSTFGDFEAYQVQVLDHEIDSVKPGDFVCITCKIKRFNNTIENAGGATCEIVDPATVGFIRDIEPLDVSIADALSIGGALAEGAQTADPYRIIGYVTGFNKDDEGNMFWYMVDNYVEGVQGELKAYKCTTVGGFEPKDGDQVELVGKLKLYQGVVEVDHGVAKLLNAQAIPEVMMEESNVKAVKVVDNGQLIIIRNGVKYNVQGAVMR